MLGSLVGNFTFWGNFDLGAICVLGNFRLGNFVFLGILCFREFCVCYGYGYGYGCVGYGSVRAWRGVALDQQIIYLLKIII